MLFNLIIESCIIKIAKFKSIISFSDTGKEKWRKRSYNVPSSIALMLKKDSRIPS